MSVSPSSRGRVLDREYARRQAEGLKSVTPVETEAWGERYVQGKDPSGVILRLQWVTPTRQTALGDQGDEPS